MFSSITSALSSTNSNELKVAVSEVTNTIEYLQTSFMSVPSATTERQTLKDRVATLNEMNANKAPALHLLRGAALTSCVGIAIIFGGTLSGGIPLLLLNMSVAACFSYAVSDSMRGHGSLGGGLLSAGGVLAGRAYPWLAVHPGLVPCAIIAGIAYGILSHQLQKPALEAQKGAVEDATTKLYNAMKPSVEDLKSKLDARIELYTGMEKDAIKALKKALSSNILDEHVCSTRSEQTSHFMKAEYERITAEKAMVFLTRNFPNTEAV